MAPGGVSLGHITQSHLHHGKEAHVATRIGQEQGTDLQGCQHDHGPSLFNRVSITFHDCYFASMPQLNVIGLLFIFSLHIILRKDIFIQPELQRSISVLAK